MTDFRALCAELHAAFNTYAVDEAHHDLLVRARAALAQPEPQSLAEEALLAIDTAVADDRLSPAVAHAVRRALERLQEIADQAAQWGSDQELDACCEWIADNSLHHAESDLLNDLRAARRPQPQSLAEEALETLMQADGADHPVPVLVLPVDEVVKIRRALERLQELEGQGDD